MKAIIPTGGRGTRMQPLTFSANKHFIPVANKPLIFYPIETLAQAGLRDFAITYNLGYLDMVKHFLGNGSKWGLNFTYILQEKPIGLANIVQVCASYLRGEKFVLHLGDNIFVDGIKAIVEQFLQRKPNGLVTMIKHPQNNRMGVPYFDKKDKLIKYVEKPPKPPHQYAVPGLYFADANFFKCFRGKDKIKPSPRGEYEIPSAFQWMIDHEFLVEVIEYQGKWLDPGKFDDWIEANQYLLDRFTQTNIKGTIDKNSQIENRVSLDKKSQIISSQIRGPVQIGENVKIVNSYIGPYTSISNGCQIIDSSIENSVLMENVNVTDVKLIDNSLIGKDSEIHTNHQAKRSHIFFVGEKSQISL
ncbi:MAG: glucose-1-phosphate thymidylyltransferase [Patescibacteria group bacterium]|nr:glucose-1-phosphate thymidylyltransferase [Patescibacteria group bacterium]